ncbi:MAG: glycoside hydrolase family 2, partial [Lentisphaerae bacterium]|nr:glycoside hydrolase family 2 [Lentisphaerota bacterium]
PEIQRRQVLEMIRRDRNHPCIIMWSMGNETDNAADGRWARAEDPTRIIHYRKVKGPTPACDHSHLNLDMENLLRCTVRGWWEPAAMDPDCAPLPQDNPSGQITGTEAWQHAGARMRDVNIRARIDDDTVAWIYADHGAGRIYRNCPLKHINPKGWVDPYRQPKQIYWLWQANHSRRLMVHARDYFWRPAQLGSVRDIVVDSNGESVALYVDEELIGERRPSRDNLFSVVFEQVLVRCGVLRAVARRGADTAVHEVPMSGPATALRLRADPQVITADRAGIALITVDVVDGQGVPVIGARPTITWRVDGPGRLLAPEVFESEIDRREELNGTFYTVIPVFMPVRSRGTPGAIRITAASPGLCAAEVLVESRPPAPAPDDGIVEPQLAESAEISAKQPQDVRRRDEAATMFFADIDTGSTDRDTIRRRLWQKFEAVAALRRDDQSADALVEHLTDLALANQGVLIADDANFHLCRLLREQVSKKA